VNVITGFTTDAIKAAPSLSTSSRTEIISDLANNTNTNISSEDFARLTAATTSSPAVGTSWTGSSTTFSGSYTPEGSITGQVSVVTDVALGTLAPSGNVSLTDVTAQV
jgi:hypothetical protein